MHPGVALHNAKPSRDASPGGRQGNRVVVGNTPANATAPSEARETDAGERFWWESDHLWESVERHCPWPPEPSAWQVLDDACLSVMNPHLLSKGWRRALDDPLTAWHAVAAALERPECHVPEGETRPDLREACAADAMVKIALLQIKCAEKVRQDYEDLAAWMRRGIDTSDSQEEYHRRVDDSRQTAAIKLWEAYMCRTVPQEAHEWIAAVPEPEGDPSALLGTSKHVIVENEDGSGGVVRRLVATTQYPDLMEAARRLGAAPFPLDEL